jgi:hypothetical protein
VVAQPADLMNVAVEHLRRHAYELPRFPTLDRMVQRVRTVVHTRLFAQVIGQRTPAAMARLDPLLTTTEIGERQTALQPLKAALQQPSLTPLDLLLDPLAW